MNYDYLDKFCNKMEEERDYQERKWGQSFDEKNTPNDWVAYIAKYTGNSVTLPWNPEQFKTALINVATLCAAAHEWCEKN